MTENQSARIIDGKAIAAEEREAVAAEVSQLSRSPGLAVILVGQDPASEVYVNSKIKACEKAGMISIENRLPEDCTQDEVAGVIDELNAREDVDGILLQLPLPSHLDSDALIERIDPNKDVDGLTPTNVGRLVAERPEIVACTPLGALKLIKTVREDLAGAEVLVIGRSLLFGKPMQQLLMIENATVTVAHSRTVDLPGHIRNADIVIVAAGKINLVRGEDIKPGAIVIDVGINRREDNSITGDVDFEGAKTRAGAITPVPGGVGPMTIAILLRNTLDAARRRGA